MLADESLSPESVVAYCPAPGGRLLVKRSGHSLLSKANVPKPVVRKRSVKGVWQGQRAGVIFDAERMWA